MPTYSSCIVFLSAQMIWWWLMFSLLINTYCISTIKYQMTDNNFCIVSLKHFIECKSPNGVEKMTHDTQLYWSQQWTTTITIWNIHVTSVSLWVYEYMYGRSYMSTEFSIYT